MKRKIKNRNASMQKESIYCTVIATKEQLESIGITLDISNKKVEANRAFTTGYYEVKYEVEELSKILEKPIFGYYDIPKGWLKF